MSGVRDGLPVEDDQCQGEMVVSITYLLWTELCPPKVRVLKS